MEYQQQESSISSGVKVGNLDSSGKAEFIRQTYVHVAFAVLAFVLVEMIFFQMESMINFGYWVLNSGRWTWLMVLGGFMFLSSIANNWARTATKNKQYLGLMLYVVLQAIIFIPMLILAIYHVPEKNILTEAAILTLALFGGLTAIALTTKKDFSFMRSGLMIGGMIALGLIVLGTIFGFSLGLWFSVLMVILMGAAILYQTSQLIHDYDNDQYVAASLGLFSSLMTMFWYILRILMSLSRD